MCVTPVTVCLMLFVPFCAGTNTEQGPSASNHWLAILHYTPAHFTISSIHVHLLILGTTAFVCKIFISNFLYQTDDVFPFLTLIALNPSKNIPMYVNWLTRTVLRRFPLPRVLRHGFVFCILLWVAHFLFLVQFY